MDIIKASDNKAIYLNKWLPQGECKGALLILHGMAEHSGRYEDFAEYLNGQGIAVYCHDQRGHGLTGQAAGEFGHLPPKWGWHMMIDDACRLINGIRAEITEPVFLMGHSMGSFLARVLVQQNPQSVEGLILSGTGCNFSPMVKTGRALAQTACHLQGAQRRSPALHTLTFAAFNRHIKGHKTEVDWLSRDEAMVQSYLDDGFCGQIGTNGFYYELYDVNLKANQLENDRCLRKDMPILFISGDQDPVGDMGKGVKRLYEHYNKMGMLDVVCHLYPGGRHEMLNERNRQRVYEDVAQWLLGHVR